MAAFTVIELLLVLGIAATAGALGAPRLMASQHEYRAAGAARLVAARLQQARVRAITRSRDTALRVTQDAQGYVITTYEDGNANGVLAADIQSGVDVAVEPPLRLWQLAPGVDLGALPGIPGPEGSAAPGIDPVRLGPSDSVTFTAVGTATAGSLYVRGGGSAQYVVRIYGETARTRILKYHPRIRQWGPL